MPYRWEGRPVETLRRCGSPSSATHAQLDPGRRRPVEPPRGEKPCLESLAKTRRKNCELHRESSSVQEAKGRPNAVPVLRRREPCRYPADSMRRGSGPGRPPRWPGQWFGEQTFQLREGIILRRMTSSFTSQEITKPPMWA